MYRISIYVLLFIVVMLLQIFIFDRLTISVSVAPLVYVTFLVLLPIQTSQLEMLFWSLFIGVAADFCMGMAGVNTIATLFVGYTRTYVINKSLGKDMVIIGGVPNVRNSGHLRYFSYVASIVFMLTFIFFAVESLNITSWQFALQRFLSSGSVSLLFVWLLSLFFSSLLTHKM